MRYTAVDTIRYYCDYYTVLLWRLYGITVNTIPYYCDYYMVLL